MPSHTKTRAGLKYPVNDCSLEIFRKMKGFVIDNNLEPEKLPLDVNTEEEEDEFFVTF